MPEITIFDSEGFCGYKQITTFFEDFSIADHFGEEEILDTYDRIFKEWKDDYKYLTELVMVLNWKIWEHNETNNDYAKLYDKLWKKADEYACNNLKGEALDYFYQTTD